MANLEDRPVRGQGAHPLLLLLLVLLTACSGNRAPADPFGALADEIDRQITDADRGANMRSAAEQIERSGRELLELTNDVAGELASLVADYESSPEDFERLVGSYRGQRLVHLDAMLEGHLRLKELATDEEWKVLAKRGHDLISQVALLNLTSLPGSEGE